jgi:hypothetical protein
VIRPIFPTAASANHTLPSAPAVMPIGAAIAVSTEEFDALRDDVRDQGPPDGVVVDIGEPDIAVGPGGDQRGVGVRGISNSVNEPLVTIVRYSSARQTTGCRPRQR